jgi:hypothetical protein
MVRIWDFDFMLQVLGFRVESWGSRFRVKSLWYDKVPETSLLFSLFCTVFAIWKHLEAFGY